MLEPSDSLVSYLQQYRSHQSGMVLLKIPTYKGTGQHTELGNKPKYLPSTRHYKGFNNSKGRVRYFPINYVKKTFHPHTEEGNWT